MTHKIYIASPSEHQNPIVRFRRENGNPTAPAMDFILHGRFDPNGSVRSVLSARFGPIGSVPSVVRLDGVEGCSVADWKERPECGRWSVGR